MTRRRWVVIAVPAIVVLVVAAVALALHARASRPTRFAQGGPFRGQTRPAASASAEPSPSPSPSPSPPASAAAPLPPSPSPSSRAARRAATPATSSMQSTQAGPPGGKPAAPAALAAPAEGVYHYRLEGSESVAGIFSRPFPSSATVAIHDRRQTAAGTEVTLDITYIPQEHEGRVIASYGPDGMKTTFEGGSIVFLGLLSQVSQSNYTPPIVSNPYPSRAGWSGSADAHDPSNGAVSRTEHYEGTFVGTETIDAGGRMVDTLVYEWRTTFTGSERGTRFVRYWLDPARGLWVRWTEKIHGERGPIVYDDQATLTLTDGPT